MLRVFFDTTIIRNSQHKRTVWKPHVQSVLWGGREHSVTISALVETRPIEKLRGQRRTYCDARRIRFIETLAKARLIRAFWHFETKWEFSSRRPMNQSMPPLTRYLSAVVAPVRYERLLSPAWLNPGDPQLEFLREIADERYAQWKRASNVLPGTKAEKNQLLDAFYLWTAEHNRCDYFLTMDYKLIATIARSGLESRLRLIAPTEFLWEVLARLPFAIFERMGQMLRAGGTR